MKKLKSVIAVSLFALFPVLVLVATQSSTASAVKEVKLQKRVREISSIKLNMDNMLLKTRNLKKYQMQNN